MIRRPEIKFLPITFCFCWVLGVLGAQKGPKMGSERPSADRFQAVSDTIARDRRFFAKWTLFAHRSLLLHCTARETDGGTNDRVIDAFAPFEGLAPRHIENDRSCSIGGLAALDGLPRWSCQEPIFGPFWAPNSARKQKVAKMVDRYFILVVLNRLRRLVSPHTHCARLGACTPTILSSPCIRAATSYYYGRG